MSRKRIFEPRLGNGLESRLLLSKGGGPIPSVLLDGYQPARQTLSRATAPSIVTQIHTAFNSFVREYGQARAVYASTIVPGTAAAGGVDPTAQAFKNYVRFRVERLGQELNSAMLQGATGRSSHGGGPSKNLFSAFARVVQARVNGHVSSTDDSNFRPGTLGRALIDTTPASTSSPAIVSIDFLAQDQAISAARASVINGFSYNKAAANGGHSGR